MSVIPLTIGQPESTIVETRSDFEKAGGLDGQVILVKSLDRCQLQTNDDSNISYDLRIGPEYWDHRDLAKGELPEGKDIPIHPGDAIIIQTEEWVQFPKCMFGQIVPKVSLLQEGISNTSSKVDPGYEGNLLITIYNLGKKEVRLSRGQPFCSLYILRVEDGARPYGKQPKRITSAKARGKLRRSIDWIQRNSALLSVLSVIAYIVSAIVVIITSF
jgi:dCTP deaminase